MSALKLFLLGQPRFERDGQPLTFDTRKNVALVAYLALTGGCHSRETLITLLWPELEPRRARAVLRRNLSVLGKTLGGEWLVVDGDEIGTDPSTDFWLDVDRFRHLLSICQTHGHSDTQVCSQCLDMLAEAAELYQGDLLEGTSLRDSAAFDEWQFFQTESLRQAFAAALEKLARGHSARGEWEAAIRYARRWLSLDPLHEAAHQRLMELYAWAGQRTAALRQYAECERILRKELQVEPSRDTTALYERLRDGAAQRPSAAALPDAAPPAFPTGTVTFLLTDIQGSTPLWEQKPQAMKAAVARHHAILRQAIEANGGVVFKVIGDAFQAAFDLASRGLAAALAAQRALRAEDWGEIGPMRVRMGLHTGPAELSGNDYAVSHTLNRVARVMSAGHGGQILLSREVADLVSRELPSGVSLRDLGEHHLKGMLHPEHLYQVTVPDLTQDFPPLVTLDRPLHNLPTQLTPFVGREALLAQVEERLCDPTCRMLTLVGPGGSGKTRLALETAARQIDRYSHGAFFVSLASLRSIESILPTIAQALGFPLHSEGEPKEQLLKYLQGKSMLLILDNWEHLLDGAGLVAEILAAAPQVTILSTSRTRLNMETETIYPIEGMDYPASEGGHPGDVQDAAGYSAVKLFLTAARRVWSGYELTSDNLTGIIRICRLVEGMPLGILLAASWVQVLPVAEIADQIAHSLDFLETEFQNVPERHRSMRAVLDHSWALLTARERDVMQGLAVFRGGFVREAARQVAGVSLPELRALINKSLLHWQPSGRYHIHELVRQYAGERLAQSPTAAESAAGRHCAWYTSALQQWMADLKGPRQQDVLAEMDAEIENAHTAWDWAVEHALTSQLLPAIDGLCTYYQRRGRLEEGQTLCRSVVEKLQSSACAGKMATSPPPAQLEAWPDASERQRLLAKALTWHALFVRLTGYAGLAGPILERSIALLDALESHDQDVRAERALALLEMGWQTLDLGRVRTRRCFEQSLDLYQALDDRWGMAGALYALGWLIDGLGDYDGARRVLDESLAIRQAMGDRQGTANSLVQLGLIALRVGQLEQGEDLLRRSVALLREMGERVSLVWGLHLLGFAAFLQGRFEHGIAIQEECLAIASDLALGHDRGMALQALGTYHAMLGRYERARAYATTGLAHARALGDPYVIGATCLVLGLISLAQEDYVNTQGWSEQSLAAYQEMGQQDAQSWSLTYLGYAAQGLGDLIQARHYLYQALQMGIEADAFLPIVIALSGSALLVARIGDADRAMELWALLSRYPLISNAPLIQDTAGRYIAAVTAALPPETAVIAKERGLSRDLYVAAAEILAWLDT